MPATQIHRYQSHAHSYIHPSHHTSYSNTDTRYTSQHRARTEPGRNQRHQAQAKVDKTSTEHTTSNQAPWNRTELVLVPYQSNTNPTIARHKHTLIPGRVDKDRKERTERGA